MGPDTPSTPAAPLRACLISGGASRRMGQDKALLPHPEGGSWLERSLRLLLELNPAVPVTLLSRHQAHLQRARELKPVTLRSLNSREAAAADRVDARILALAEPAPWDGPLRALQRLMERHPEERLLLCPVDMPALTLPVLKALRDAAAVEPSRIHLAHDGTRRQPLLGVYPSQAAIRLQLGQALADGERRLQGWLASQSCRDVPLEAQALRNVNHPWDLPSLQSGAPSVP